MLQTTDPKSDTTVIVTLRREGFHQWPEAPAHRDYLRSSHRHLFTYRIGVRVTSTERQVEFHDLQGWLRVTVRHDWGASSCESIAMHIAAHAKRNMYPTVAFVEVWEDDEVGARVEVS